MKLIIILEALSTMTNCYIEYYDDDDVVEGDYEHYYFNANNIIITFISMAYR